MQDVELSQEKEREFADLWNAMMEWMRHNLPAGYAATISGQHFALYNFDIESELKRGATMTNEQEQAVRSYISQVQFAIKNVPDVPASHIFACGCMGPLPECACARRNRLVREFMGVPK